MIAPEAKIGTIDVLVSVDPKCIDKGSPRILKDLERELRGARVIGCPCFMGCGEICKGPGARVYTRDLNGRALDLETITQMGGTPEDLRKAVIAQVRAEIISR